MNERPIGSRFDDDGKTMRVKAGGACCHCYYQHADCSRLRSWLGECASKRRTDEHNVVFIEVQPISEPVTAIIEPAEAVCDVQTAESEDG